MSEFSENKDSYLLFSILFGKIEQLENVGARLIKED